MPCFDPGVPVEAGAPVTDLLFVHPFSAGALYRPRNRAELVAAVMRARDAGNSLRAHGSNWSPSPAGVAQDVVDTSALHRHLSLPFPGGGGQLPAGRMRDGASNFLHAAAAQSPLAQGRRFVHVEAGVKIRELLDDLARCGSALPTMGDGAGQSLIGAISTGTHGGDLAEPPLADRIQALHLVSASGREIWITPSQSPFADSSLVTRLPDWCGDAKFIADDTTFAAARLGVGRMGIVYSVVLEVVEQYTLIEANTEHRWSEMRAQLATSRMTSQGPTGVFDAPISDLESGWLRSAILQRTEFVTPDGVFRYESGPEKWPVAPAFFDQNPQVYRQLLANMRLDGLADDLHRGPAMPLHHINLAISLPEPHRCFMRRRWKRIPPVRELNVGHAPDDDLVAAVKANKTNPPGIVDAIKQRLEIDPFLNVALIIAHLDPILGPLTHSAQERKERLDFYLDSEISNIAHQHGAIGATSGETLFIVLHRIANDPVLEARADVARAAGAVIAGSFSRTARAGRASGGLGQNMLDAHDYGIDGAQAGSSGEFHFDATSSDYLDFVDDVIGAALRRHPVFGYIGVRFTPRSSALIAMQQYSLTASVEVSTIRSRLEDVYRDFWGEVHDRARARGGIPHWGQEMRHTRAELEAAYGDSLAQWRSVLADLVDGFPEVFRTGFSIDKGLEPSSSATIDEVFLLGLSAGADDEPITNLNRRFPMVLVRHLLQMFGEKTAATTRLTAILDDLAAKSAEKLDWRDSVVDLLKLLGMDSGLADRKRLATELGFTGDFSDTAMMNIFLHNRIIMAILENHAVDVVKILDDLVARNAEKLDWRDSVVDLMKLFGMGSGLAKRERLVTKLGFTGELSGSDTMNMWLHARLIIMIVDNGGKLAAEL